MGGGGLVREPVLTSGSALTSPYALNSAHTHTHTNHAVSWQASILEMTGHAGTSSALKNHTHTHTHTHTKCSQFIFFWTISRAISPLMPPGLGGACERGSEPGEKHRWLMMCSSEGGGGSSVTLVKTRLTRLSSLLLFKCRPEGLSSRLIDSTLPAGGVLSAVTCVTSVKKSRGLRLLSLITLRTSCWKTHSQRSSSHACYSTTCCVSP